MCFNRFDTPCMCTPSQAHDQQMNPYTETFQTRYREQRGEGYNGLNSQSQWHSSAPLPTREEYGHNPSAPGQRRRDDYDRWVKERIAIEALLEMADQPFPAELSKSIHPNLLQGKNISNGTLRHIEMNEVSRHPTTSPQNTLFQSTHSVELADTTSSEDESFEVTEPVAETVQNKSAVTTLTSSEWLSLAFKVQTIHSPTTWHVDGMRVKNSRRKLVPSVDGVASGAASQHQLHKPVEVTIHDLPLIPCVIGKCTEVCRGRDIFELHLRVYHRMSHRRDKSDDGKECLVKGCKNVMRGGGMLRHIIEYHTNVWIYCTMCDERSVRHGNIISHFRKCHPEHRLPRLFREIYHQDE